MITELKSIPDIWKRMPSEMHARRFLEGIIWSTGRHCPHCGSVASSALRGRTCRPGLYQRRDCRLQFTVTTLTPMHGTKLDLRIWICAMFMVLTSSTPVDRLANVGTHGMGALMYRPEERSVDPNSVDLEWFADLATSMGEDASVEDLRKARAAAGGSAGARPKLVALLDVETGRVRDHRLTPERGERQVLIKHPAITDSPTAIGEEEAYARMARAAGIAMPWTMVLRSRRGDTFLAVERFDRNGAGRVHMHTAAGLLDVDFRQPSIDYENLLKLVRWTTRHAEDQDEMFCRMTFNVLTHNRDDHLKNHAFLMDAGGSWRLSPTYDVSFSDGPGGEHHLAIAGEGHRPGRKHLEAVGRALGMKPEAIAALLDPVRAALADWPRHADAAGVPSRRAKQIAGYFAT